MSEELKEKSVEAEELNQTQTEDETTATETEEAQAPETDEKAEPKEEEEQKEPTVEEQLEKAQAEIADLNDKLLRKIAEFDNYRKRTLKEKTELILNGGEKAITTILPIIDDMERALKTMKNAEDVNAVVEGVELIYKKFLGILAKEGVEPIDTKEADFDTDLHEAIAQFPAPSDELKGKVIDCTLTGYKLNDKVIRHAQVVVGV